MTPAERKRKQRRRDELAGWRELRVKVGQEHVESVRDFVASLPPPAPPTDPNQLSMIEQLDRAIDGRDASQEEATGPDQGSLF